MGREAVGMKQQHRLEKATQAEVSGDQILRRKSSDFVQRGII